MRTCKKCGLEHLKEKCPACRETYQKAYWERNKEKVKAARKTHKREAALAFLDLSLANQVRRIKDGPWITNITP